MSRTKLYDQAIMESEEYLTNLGLVSPKRPKTAQGYFNGHLPSDIHEASIEEVKKYITLMTVFADYVQDLRINCEAEKDSAYEKLKTEKARIRLSKNGSKDAKDDATITDDEYILANAEYMSKNRSYKKIVGIEESTRRNIRTLSRLISTEELSNENDKIANTVYTPTQGKRRWK